jgi:hypothetical protein
MFHEFFIHPAIFFLVLRCKEKRKHDFSVFCVTLLVYRFSTHSQFMRDDVLCETPDGGLKNINKGYIIWRPAVTRVVDVVIPFTPKPYRESPKAHDLFIRVSLKASTGVVWIWEEKLTLLNPQKMKAILGQRWGFGEHHSCYVMTMNGLAWFRVFIIHSDSGALIKSSYKVRTD